MKGLSVQILKDTQHNDLILLPYVGVCILLRIGDAEGETPGTDVVVPNIDDAFTYAVTRAMMKPWLFVKRMTCRSRVVDSGIGALYRFRSH